MHRFFMFFLLVSMRLYAQNQTDTVSNPLPENSLPFRISLRQSSFSMPAGLHSYAFAVYKGKWLLIAGRTNGLHNVDNTDPSSNSFPPSYQNTDVYVVDPKKQKVYVRSLHDPKAKLSQAQIDLLSVTNSESYHETNTETLYIVGGYGIDSATGQMTTKSALSVINVPGLINWVMKPGKNTVAAKYIRQTSHPLLQVAGGALWRADAHQPFLLVFGQNFTGYYVSSSDGAYTQQIRPFQIVDNGTDLFVQPYKQPVPNPSYRRRDLNVVPIMKKKGTSLTPAFVALSGVFLPGPDGGAWTVPVEINGDGSSFMQDPSNPNTFAQGMNNYACANLGLYSKKTNNMYLMLFGGLSFLIISDGTQASCTASPPINNGIITSCSNLPFVNDITTIRIDPKGHFQQYLMSGKFPTITATFGTSPGGPIWFGTSGEFFPAEKMPLFPNGVISLDNLDKFPVRLGYIVGGIASSVADTNSPSDSIASPYIFDVILERP